MQIPFFSGLFSPKYAEGVVLIDANTGLPYNASGGGSGGGGAVTVANGADVAEGSTTDAVPTAVSAAALTAIGAQKGILSGVGFQADAAATNSTGSWSAIALLKGLFARLPGLGPSGGQEVEGTVADNTADSGNTVKTGGLVAVNTSAVFYAVGTRAPIAISQRGIQRMSLMNQNSAEAALGSPSDATGDSTTLYVTSFGEVWDPTAGSWRKARGDTNGGAWSKQAPTAGTDRSLTVTTTSQTLMAANTLRNKFILKNDSATGVWINIGGTATAAAGTGNFQIAANGGYLELQGTNSAVTIISTASVAITCREF